MKRNVAALDFIAQCLRPQSSTEKLGALCAEIDALPLGWETVVALANRQFVTSALWAAVRRRSDVSTCLPEDLRGYLAAIHRLNRKRNERLKRQTSEVVGHMSRFGVTPILLKGAAHLYTDTFDDGGARMMADLDMFLPESEIETAWNGLLDLGYRSKPGPGVDYALHHHLAPLVRPGEPAPIELHRHVLFTPDLVPAASAHESARTVAAGDLAMQILSPTHQVLQNFWHSEIADERYHRGVLSIRYLHELIRLDANYSDEIDWAFIRQIVERRGMSRALDAYLYLAHRLLGLVNSNGARDNLSSRFHYSRCRSCVRWGWARFVDRRIRGVQFRLERAPSVGKHPKP